MDEIRSIQLRELAILEKFDSICRKNGLCYFLVGGTLIGAMRHNGFIPWDDDVDIGMPEKDYDWFVKHIAEILPVGLRFVPENTPDTWIGLARLTDGEYDIDIFPYENKPNLPYLLVGLLLRFRHGGFHHLRKAKQHSLKYKIAFWHVVHGFAVLTWRLLCWCFPFGGWHMRPEASFPNHGKKEQYIPVQFHEFEGRDYPIPADYEAILASEYKNWRELPPVEQRKPSHCSRIKKG